MSNIYGVVVRNSEAALDREKQFHASGYVKVSEFGKILVYTEAESRNIYIGEVDKGKLFIVSGVGSDGKLFTEKEWQNVLRNGMPFNKFPDGHYAAIVISDSSVEFYTDPTGIRDLYFMETEDETFFSTRPDWFANFKDMKINFTEFSSRWLLFNQLSHNSVLHGVTRITAGRTAKINTEKSGLHIDDTNVQSWMNRDHYSYDELFERLKTNVIKAGGKNGRISLSLSGGMDSRVILSYLLNSVDVEWDTHTFGDRTHPDAQVAGSICKDLGLTHELFGHTYPDTDTTAELLRDYSCQTLVNNSASAIIQLKLYDNLAGKNRVIIDGGFGEIWRRDFFNRLFYKGKKDLISKDPKRIYRHLLVHRADIFNEEINRKMKEGVLSQTADLLESIPSFEETGIENWLDMIGIKTRLVNYYGPEQTRLDTMLKSYMPFAQKSLLDILLSVPVRERRNGKIFRKIIEQNFRSLKNFPLAKGSFTYPFRLGTLQSRLYSIARRKLKWKLYADNVRQKFLDTYSEYIKDNINSKDVRECGLYDYSKVKSLADGYYRGNESLAHELDWWLAFDEFRRGLEKRKPET